MEKTIVKIISYLIIGMALALAMLIIYGLWQAILLLPKLVGV